jgi:hypothetical protein
MAMLYSLAEFLPIILPLLRAAKARHLVEIGAEAGIMTRALIAYTAEAGGSVTEIEVMPTAEVAALVAAAPHARLAKGLSLEILPTLEAADAYLIDGDHNYYTVLHELLAIRRSVGAARRPLLAFLHDVGWPFGRRDGYCDPETIPAAFRQPHDWINGVRPGLAELAPDGFRGLGGFAMATTEGGARNGVCTAVEDFLAADGAGLRFVRIPAIFGLGVLYAADAPWSAEAEAILAPYADNPLLAAMERDRLQHFAELIALQYRVSNPPPPSS